MINKRKAVELTRDELDIIETNKARALARQREHLKRKDNDAAAGDQSKEFKRIDLNYCDYNLSTMKDTKGGFIIENDDPVNDKSKEFLIPPHPVPHVQDIMSSDSASKSQTENAVVTKDLSVCRECRSLNISSRYFEGFGVAVCKSCIEKVPEKYTLLTKTECREDYLLTEPELNDKGRLKRIEKPNPHKSTWNNMLLFMREQVEEFALEKWNSWEALDEEFEKRQKIKEEKKQKKFHEKLSELRKKTRTSFWKSKREAAAQKTHVHTWTNKVWDEDEQMYRQNCKDCGVSTLIDEI